MSLLAIDIGSSRCKGVLFSASGEILAQCSRLYAPEFSHPSFAEMNPDIFREAVQAVSRSAANLQHPDLQQQDPIEAVCLSSHGETLIAANPLYRFASSNSEYRYSCRRGSRLVRTSRGPHASL